MLSTSVKWIRVQLGLEARLSGQKSGVRVRPPRKIVFRIGLKIPTSEKYVEKIGEFLLNQCSMTAPKNTSLLKTHFNLVIYFKLKLEWVLECVRKAQHLKSIFLFLFNHGLNIVLVCHSTSFWGKTDLKFVLETKIKKFLLKHYALSSKHREVYYKIVSNKLFHTWLHLFGPWTYPTEICDNRFRFRNSSYIYIRCSCQHQLLIFKKYSHITIFALGILLQD